MNRKEIFMTMVNIYVSKRIAERQFIDSVELTEKTLSREDLTDLQKDFISSFGAFHCARMQNELNQLEDQIKKLHKKIEGWGMKDVLENALVLASMIEIREEN